MAFWVHENERKWDESTSSRPDLGARGRTVGRRSSTGDFAGSPASDRSCFLAGACDQSRNLPDPGIESEPVQWLHRRILARAYWLHGTGRVRVSDTNPALAREARISA